MRPKNSWSLWAGLVLAASLVLAVASKAEAANYGDLAWMSSAGGPTSVPANWVIIQQTATQYQIKYVGGATYGAKVVVTLNSAVPPGWIIDFVLGGNVGSRYLEYVTGAPYATSKTVTLDSPVPTGWVIVPVLGGTAGSRIIQCAIGAAYPAQLRTTTNSPVPLSWVVTFEDASGRYITCLTGAPFGTLVTVTLDSPVPTNWLINYESAVNRRLVNMTGAVYGSRVQVALRSPVPSNWVIVREDSVYRDLTYVAGAAYQAQVTVTYSSPIWPNWVVVAKDAVSRLLRYVAGAPLGTVVTVTFDSPVPTGWVVISTAATTRDIRFGPAGLPAPTGLTAVKGGGFIDLKWNAVAGAIGYNVKQRIAKTDPYVTIAANQLSPHYIDTNVGATTYYYVVTAIGADGKESPPSNEVATSPLAEPEPPTNVVATPGDSRVTLTWKAPSGAAYYNVKRALNTKGPYSLVANMITTTSYADTLVSNGTLYFYVVTAINIKNIESGLSAEVSARPNIPPFAATNLKTVAGNRIVSLSWTRSPSPDVTGYNVYRYDAANPTYALLPGSPIPIDEYIDNTVSNGVFYTYVVRALNVSNQESPNSNLASAAPFGPPAPPAPTGLIATPFDRSAALSWAAGTGISYYHVKRSTSRGGPYYSVVGSPKTNSYTDTGLTNGTTYYYVVSALDSAGSEGPNSNEVSAQPYVPTLAPPAPTGLQAAGTGFSIQLSWTASPNATSYRVERALFEDGPWNSAGKSATVMYEDVNVLYGVTYYYRVMALNYIGEGDPSEAASARP